MASSHPGAGFDGAAAPTTKRFASASPARVSVSDRARAGFFCVLARTSGRVAAVITSVILPLESRLRTLVGMDNARRYWYGAKRYPFGCRFPLTWEGWLVDAIWIASFIGISPLLRPDSRHYMQGLGLYFGLIAVFMAIRSWKGEPRWHD
jgi:hypothetical protein